MDSLPNSWDFFGYEVNEPASAFGSFQSFVELWRKKFHSDGSLPCWQDFDFYDFEGLWGKISLAKVLHDPFDISFVLWGTGFTEYWGKDYTNKTLRTKATAENIWEQAEQDYFAALVKKRFIGLSTGTLSVVGRDHTTVQLLDLPLVHNGEVTHVLSVFQKCDSKTAYLPLIPPIENLGLS